MADLGCGATCMKYILFLLNIIFFLAGAGILGVALWLRFEPSAKSVIDVVQSPLFDAAVYTLIAVGAFIFLVGFLGCCGACRESSCMLCMYAGLLVIIFILEIAAAIIAIVYKGKMGSELKDEMYSQVHEKLKNDNQDLLTITWNTLQYQFKCCGAQNYTDYIGSKYAEGKPDQFPLTCCKMDKFDQTNPTPDNPAACKKEYTDQAPAGNLYGIGCYSGLVDWVNEHSVILIGIGFAVAALQIFCIIFACCVRSQIND